VWVCSALWSSFSSFLMGAPCWVIGGEIGRDGRRRRASRRRRRDSHRAGNSPAYRSSDVRIPEKGWNGRVPLRTTLDSMSKHHTMWAYKGSGGKAPCILLLSSISLRIYTTVGLVSYYFEWRHTYNTKECISLSPRRTVVNKQ
jgi:hypothetical protein